MKISRHKSITSRSIKTTGALIVNFLGHREPYLNGLPKMVFFLSNSEAMILVFSITTLQNVDILQLSNRSLSFIIQRVFSSRFISV
jgi:hypothetical protein